MTTIKVYPNKPSALSLKHPVGPKMEADGVLWPNDSFTARRLTDGSVTETAPELAPRSADEPVHEDHTAS